MSLDQEVTSNSGESTSLYDVIAEKDTVEPIEAMEDRELKDRMIIEIEKLPKNEKLVIALYYYEELTLKEIGKILDLSESRISQIHSKVVKDLKIRLEL